MAAAVGMDGVLSAIIDPGAFLDVQRNYIGAQRAAAVPGGAPAAIPSSSDYKKQYEEYKRKEIMNQVLLNQTGLAAGRTTVPATNFYQQSGRTGLVDPSLTGQETPIPMPFDQRYNTAANMQAIMQSLPASTMQQNLQIVKTVDSTIPQMQRALKQEYTIYEQFPKSFVQNRLNIALQNRRVNSIYAVV